MSITDSNFCLISLIQCGLVGLLICRASSWQSQIMKFRQCQMKIILLRRALTSSCLRIQERHSFAYFIIGGHSQSRPSFFSESQKLYLMKLKKLKDMCSCGYYDYQSLSVFVSGLKSQKAIENSQERLVYTLTKKSTADTAPIMPPIKENTADSFCTSREQTIESEPLTNAKYTNTLFILVWKGWLTARSSTNTPLSSTTLAKGQILQSVETVQSVKQRKDSVPILLPKIEQLLSQMQYCLQLFLSELIWVLVKQTVKQMQFWLRSMQAWIYYGVAHGCEGLVALLHAETTAMYSEYFFEEYWPQSYIVVFIGGHSHLPLPSSSKELVIQGQSLKNYLLQVYKGTWVALRRLPFYQYQCWNVTSKYLLVSERLRCQIYTAKRKGESGVILMVDKVGSLLLTVSVEVLMEERSRVLRIMLAKPTRMVMMIPSEMMPPVNVLYQSSASQRSISVEQKKSVCIISFLIFLNKTIESMQNSNLLQFLECSILKRQRAK